MTDREVQLFNELIAELRQLRRAIERQRKPSRLTRADFKLLPSVLPAIEAIWQDDPFLAHELLEHDGLRVLLGDKDASAIGKLLDRAEGTDIDGRVIERVGCERNTSLWRVAGGFEASEGETPPTRADGHGSLRTAAARPRGSSKT